MVKPEGVSLTADPERSVAGKPPVPRPVLHVDGQLVEGLVVDVGEGPDEDVPQPELPIEVPEADLVVLPAPHEVLVRLHVVPDLENHPAPSLGLQVTVDLPGPLGQVGRVDQVNTGLGGPWLTQLDGVA